MQKASIKNNFYYNNNLLQKARDLRNSMTKAEACLWKYALKSKQMNGQQFTRQRPALDYIVDFMCKELLLIIEVDGISHHFDETEKKDFIRQQRLEQIGFTVLRFRDSEILNNIGSVIHSIENFIKDRT